MSAPHVILQTVQAEGGTYRAVVPRGRVYESEESAQAAVAEFMDLSGRVRHTVARLYEIPRTTHAEIVRADR